MRVIFALERTNSFREKAYIDTNKPKSPMKANFMFSKEGRCASHYNRQNPIRLDKPRNTEPKFHLVNKNLRVESCCPHHVHSPTKWVRDPGEPHLLCIKTRVVSRRICLKDSTSQIDFSWKAFIFFFLTYYFSFSFSALDVFKLRAQNQHLENTAHKTTQCVCSIHIPSAMGWIFPSTAPWPNPVPRTHFNGCRITHWWVFFKFLHSPGLCYHSYQQAAVITGDVTNLWFARLQRTSLVFQQPQTVVF